MILNSGKIKAILKEERISISKRRGQNFLVDAWVEERIINAIDIKPTDEILEIGPGLGALTQALVERAGVVFAVEKDKALARVLSRMFSGYKNLKIIHQDILKTNLAALSKKEMKIIGNLPYYITTPIIGYLLEEQRQSVKEIYITVQDEVARRLVAETGTKDYSALSVFVQYYTEPQILFSIPKRAFYPQPKVNSAFVHLYILKRPCVEVNNQEQFFKIVRACFNQRRKTILNSLAHKLRTKIEKENIQQVLEEASIEFQARPERLSLGEFARIEDVFYKKGVRL